MYKAEIAVKDPIKKHWHAERKQSPPLLPKNPAFRICLKTTLKNHPLSSAKSFVEYLPTSPHATSQENLALKRLGLKVRCLAALGDANPRVVAMT